MSDAILNTLIYADIFDYPLTREELYQYLISDHFLDKKTFNLLLLNLVKKKKVKQIKNRVGETQIFFCLPKREGIISLRKKRKIYTLQKTKKTRNCLQFLKKIPTIKAIYFTGSISMSNTKEEDDIDIMIITQQNSLWLTRLLVTIVLDLFDLRRKPEQGKFSREVSDKICPNLYLDEANLELKTHQQNLYTAHEVVQAKVVWQRNDFAGKFVNSNAWVTKFLPHSPLPQLISLKPNTLFITKMLSLIIQPLDLIAYQFQRIYMQKRKTIEKVSKTSAYFHPRNTSQLIMQKYLQKQQDLKIV